MSADFLDTIPALRRAGVVLWAELHRQNLPTAWRERLAYQLRWLNGAEPTGAEIAAEWRRLCPTMPPGIEFKTVDDACAAYGIPAKWVKHYMEVRGDPVQEGIAYFKKEMVVVKGALYMSLGPACASHGVDYDHVRTLMGNGLTAEEAIIDAYLSGKNNKYFKKPSLEEIAEETHRTNENWYCSLSCKKGDQCFCRHRNLTTEMTYVTQPQASRRNRSTKTMILRARISLRASARTDV